MAKNMFETVGKRTEKIGVQISHQILKLFSEGLYTSPHKAVEELVSNSYDAAAKNAHVIVSDDLLAADASIVVIDDGEGMDAAGLRRHWVIGKSTRRKRGNTLKRDPIGRFGIGKLATYVLANKLTHISKVGGGYYATTMVYSDVVGGGSDASGEMLGSVEIPLRELNAKDAKSAVQAWTEGSAAGYKAIPLFGNRAPDSWTVSIMSDLKQRGRDTKEGILRRVLSTAMPRRGDFNLFLNGTRVDSPKIGREPVGVFVLGKDVREFGDSFAEMEVEEKAGEKNPMHRHGLFDPSGLGRITGFIEIYDQPIPPHHQGFFVYVRGRQINVEDSGFGIPRNTLRHGTFSQFRMVVHIDNLDEDITSSRESLRDGDLLRTAQGFLIACFNYARGKLKEHDDKKSSGYSTAKSISDAPGSVTRGPLLSLAKKVAAGSVKPFYLRYPTGLAEEQQSEFLKALGGNEPGDAAPLFKSVKFQQLSAGKGFAVFDVGAGDLLVNESHPFVAVCRESFQHPTHSHPLELLIMAEILMEAYLYHKNVGAGIIRDAIKWRDEMLRIFVRSSSRRTAEMISLALIEARNDPKNLEAEICAAFEALGFVDVRHLGGPRQPDGIAEAPLAAKERNTPRYYRVSLEAKSGAKPLTAKDLGAAGIFRHMKENACDHSLVVANHFATTAGEDATMIKEIRELRKGSDKTVTLMLVDDLAALVKIAATKQVGLEDMRGLFKKCVLPEDSKKWVEDLKKSPEKRFPYREVLEAIWRCSKNRPNDPVEYGAVLAVLDHRELPIRIERQDLVECCRALQFMTGGSVFAGDNSVGIEQAPELILKKIGQNGKLGKEEGK